MSSRSSFVTFLAIQLVFILILLFANGSDAVISRTWPVPALPPGVVNREFPTDPMEYINPWRDYLIYLAIVFVSPVIFALLALVFVVIASILRCCTFIVPNPLTKKNMSVGSIRILGLIPFAIAYAILFVATAFSIGFFAWFFVGFMSLRKSAFEVASDAISLPSNVVTGVTNIADEIPNIMNNFVALVNNVTNVQDTVDEILGHINTTKSAVGGITPYLDTNYQKYTTVKSIQTTMVSRVAGGPIEMQAVDFTAFDDVFRNSTDSIGAGINSTLDDIYTLVSDSTSQITNGIGQINTHIGDLNSTVMGTINDLKGIVQEYVRTIENYYNDYVTPSRVDEVSFFFQIGEIIVAVIIALIIPIVLVIMTIGFLWIFLRCCSCLACLDVCACLAMLLYAVIGGLCLVTWFLTTDACSQAEDFLVRNEEYYNIQPYTFTTPTGSNITVKYSDALLGVLKCDDNGNYLDATGFSIEAFDIPNFIGRFEDPLKQAINQFNVSTFTDSITSQLNDVVNNIDLAGNFEVSVNQLKEAVNTTIWSFFGTFPLELTLSDFQNHNSTLDALNAILTSYSLPTVTGSEVCNLSPFAYSNGVPGKITGPGEDALYTTYYTAVTNAADKNQIWGSLAMDSSNNQIAPGAVDKGYVLMLCKMNVGSPIFAMETYNDYVSLFKAYDELVDSVRDTETYAKDILDFEPAVQNITTKVNAKMDEVFESVRDYIYDSIDSLLGKVTSLDILKCGNVGKLYRTFRSSICGNFQIAVGGTSVTALSSVLIMILIILVLYHAQCLSVRKRKSFLDDDEDEDNYDAKINAMEKTLSSINGSAVPPQPYNFLGTQYYVPSR